MSNNKYSLICEPFIKNSPVELSIYFKIPYSACVEIEDENETSNIEF